MVGRRFGPYELEELLGRGGMGEVWRAIDTRKARVVALKVLPGELTGDAGVEERFRREAQVAARLNDPHVIPIHDYGELHGRLYLDMRLVQGVDLARALRTEGRMTAARAVSIIGQAADALDAAHDDGLVHRDVKPSNILLTAPRRGADDFVYLIDFGIAAGSMLGTRLTATGHAVGTAAYMAPERFTEDRDADRRVDVYALGCVLYEILTGSAPFVGTSFPNLMYQHLNAPPPRPSASSDLPPGLDTVVSTAMAKDPDQRYRRAGDLADAARTALATPRLSHVAPRTPAPSIDDRRPSTPAARRSPTYAAPPQRDAVASRSDAAAPVDGAADTAPSSSWRIASAVSAIVMHLAWGVITVVGTSITFTHCSVATASCVGGTVGVLAVGSGVVGVVAAIHALRSPGSHRRALLIAWLMLVAALVLVVTEGILDSGVPT